MTDNDKEPPDWFGPKPTPQDAVATYMAAPPQGMTNPPQSDHVIGQLMDELIEYGVAFEPDVWPPPLPQRFANEPDEHILTSKVPVRNPFRHCTNSILTGQEQRKGEHVTVEARPKHIAEKWLKNPVGGSPSKMKRAASTPAMKSAREEDKEKKELSPEEYAKEEDKINDKLMSVMMRVRLAAGRATRPVAGVFKSLDTQGRGFVPKNDFVEILKTLRCVLTPEDCHLLCMEFSPPTQREWVCYVLFLKKLVPKQRGCDERVCPKRIQSSSEASFIAAREAARKGDEGERKGAISKATRSVEESSGQPRVRFGGSETLVIGPDGKDPASQTAPAAFGKGEGKDEGAWQPNKQVVTRVIGETELKNDLAALRSMGRLHGAGVKDRFRFGAGTQTIAGAMVLSGPGSVPTCPGKWVSDMSELTKNHNGAMRVVNPSGLDELKADPRKRRKKKDEEDEMRLGDSGLFCRYPPNEPLKVLKALRRQHFPVKEEKSKEQKVMSDLMALMSG